MNALKHTHMMAIVPSVQAVHIPPVKRMGQTHLPLGTTGQAIMELRALPLSQVLYAPPNCCTAKSRGRKPNREVAALPPVGAMPTPCCIWPRVVARPLPGLWQPDRI